MEDFVGCIEPELLIEGEPTVWVYVHSLIGGSLVVDVKLAREEVRALCDVSSIDQLGKCGNVHR